MIFYWILCPLVAYLVGSIPFGLLLSKAHAGIDITNRGSGNIGATNVSRELGIQWGIITLILDALKGFLPVFITGYMLPGLEALTIATGVFSILGHLFSIFLKFQGGKGVATTIGVYLAIAPFPVVIALLIFVITVFFCDFVSLGSLAFAISVPILLFVFGYSGITIICSIVITLLICLKHRENIKRLINREETRWRRNRSSQ
jgi:glycerol-3-phosphate acyltransferase PlsY